MKRQAQKDFYIICNLELYFPAEKGRLKIVKHPVVLYEDGSLEVKSVAIFKDTSKHKKCRTSYDAIKCMMEKLKNPDRDLRLRSKFVLTASATTINDILNHPIADNECISVSDLRNLSHERRIGNSIYSVREELYKKLGRRQRRAWKTGKDTEFLKRIGDRNF